MMILSFSPRMSMEVRRRQAGQVREGKFRYSLDRLFSLVLPRRNPRALNGVCPRYHVTPRGKHYFENSMMSPD
jgi:hypothetical protein